MSIFQFVLFTFSTILNVYCGKLSHSKRLQELLQSVAYFLSLVVSRHIYITSSN